MTEYRELPAFAGYFIGDDGSVVGRAGHVLKPNGDGAGYQKVIVCLPGNQRKTIRVHRLVCEAFHGPAPSPQHIVAHEDGSRANNCAHNLRWATYEENEADKAEHGRQLLGERHFAARLNASSVRHIRVQREAGVSCQKIATALGVSRSCIEAVSDGRTWGHVQ